MSVTDTARLRELAAILLPGDDLSPAAAEVDDLEELIERALVALGRESEIVERGLGMLPGVLDWATLREFASEHPMEFEAIATVAAGAYFMSTNALDSLGYPQGPRKAPRNDLVADELGSGLLDPVLERGSILRMLP